MSNWIFFVLNIKSIWIILFFMPLFQEIFFLSEIKVIRYLPAPFYIWRSSRWRRINILLMVKHFKILSGKFKAISISYSRLWSICSSRILRRKCELFPIIASLRFRSTECLLVVSCQIHLRFESCLLRICLFSLSKYMSSRSYFRWEYSTILILTWALEKGWLWLISIFPSGCAPSAWNKFTCWLSKIKCFISWFIPWTLLLHIFTTWTK